MQSMHLEDHPTHMATFRTRPVYGTHLPVDKSNTWAGLSLAPYRKELLIRAEFGNGVQISWDIGNNVYKWSDNIAIQNAH